MTSKTRYSVRHQCSDTKKCGVRFRLRKLYTEYTKTKRCPACGGGIYCIEKSRRAELAKQEMCNCAPIPFPHRWGSLRMCLNHPLSEVEPTPEEWQEFEDMLRTPRSG